MSGPLQQITQITATGDYAPGGQIEYTHSHQKKYVPKYAAPARSYKPYPLAYGETAVAASAPAANNINAPNYTLEELAQLLSTAYGTKKGYPSSSVPLPPPSVYYSQQPEYKPEYKVPEYKPEYKLPDYKPDYKEPVYKPEYKPEYKLPEYKPIYKEPESQEYSKVDPPAPVINSAAAAVATGGRAIASAKTPYDQVVATSAPVYDSTTSYPIAAPEPEPEPLPVPVAEPVNVPEPVPQTEAYPSQTEAYPSKSYDNPASNDIKPHGSSSSFDLAIDNYLKDFGYGNQIRDVDY